MRYESATIDDLNTILKESIILYKGEPVYVYALANKERGPSIYIVPVGENVRDGKWVTLNSRYLNLNPVSLGFVNSKYGAEFVSRIPSRTYKQGLSRNNMRVSTINGAFSAFSETNHPYEVKALRDCILGIYPSLQEAIKLCNNEGRSSVAFSRKHAVDCNGQLFYTSVRIGTVSLKGEIALNWSMQEYSRTFK